MPDFSKLEPATVKRAAPFRERVYGGDNEYVPLVSAADDLHRLARVIDPRRFDDFVQPPLTFTVYNPTSECHVGMRETLVEAVRWSRKPWLVITPNRDLVGSDFADYGDRILLAELGYFSVDLPKHRAKRDHEAQREAYLDQAYDVLHLDRKAVHAMIAAKLEATRFDGIWARSTGEYSRACADMDALVLARSPAIAQSISELTQ